MIQLDNDKEKIDFIKQCLHDGLNITERISSGNISHHKTELRYILTNALQVSETLEIRT